MDVIFSGDLNQPIHHDRIRQFYLETDLHDIFSTYYDVPLQQRAKTFSRGQHCIDSIAASYNILPFISNVKLISFSQVVTNDHVAILWQLNAEMYFAIKSFRIPKPRHLTLDSNRSSHVAKFVEKAEVLASILDIENVLKLLEMEYLSEPCEFLNRTFTYILNKATRAAEGPLHCFPYSEKKLEVFSAQRYWQKFCKLLSGATIDLDALEVDNRNRKVFPLPEGITGGEKLEFATIELNIANFLVSEFKTNSN